MAFLKNMWKTNSKHSKLSNDLAMQKSKVLDPPNTDVTDSFEMASFKLKYLGTGRVDRLQGDISNTEAIKSICKMAKAKRKKLERVNLSISANGIEATDDDKNIVLKISIYNISNCAMDTTHRQVFAFTSMDEYESFQCHAFLCSKRKIAETITLTVAQAFSSAYVAWRSLPSTKEYLAHKTNQNNFELANREVHNEEVVEAKLIDFDDDDESFFNSEALYNEDTKCRTFNNSWVCFEDDFDTKPHQSNFPISLTMS